MGPSSCCQGHGQGSWKCLGRGRGRAPPAPLLLCSPVKNQTKVRPSEHVVAASKSQTALVSPVRNHQEVRMQSCPRCGDYLTVKGELPGAGLSKSGAGGRTAMSQGVPTAEHLSPSMKQGAGGPRLYSLAGASQTPRFTTTRCLPGLFSKGSPRHSRDPQSQPDCLHQKEPLKYLLTRKKVTLGPKLVIFFSSLSLRMLLCTACRLFKKTSKCIFQGKDQAA